jgi:hypothetical protein
MLTKKSILLLAVIFPIVLFGQNENFKQKWYKGWDIGAMGGGSYFAMEMKKDFSKVSMDMNTNPTGSFNIHLDKTAKGKFGFGFEFGKNYFSGDKTYPTKINWLLYDTERFNKGNSHFVVAPVYFKTNLTSFFVNLNYNFQNFQDKRRDYLNSNMYLKLGAGLSSVGVEMGYKDPKYYKESQLLNPLYEKGQGVQSIRDMYGSMHFGGGVNYYLSNRFSLTSELMFLFVSNNYMDGVQNVEVTFKPDGTPIPNKYDVFSFIVELKVGISFHYNWYRKYKVNAAWEQTQEDFQNEFYYGGSSNMP